MAQAAHADAATARAQEDESKTERARLELRIREMEQAHSKLAATNATNEAEVLRLKEAAKPRKISPAQATIIVGLMKPFAGQTVEIKQYALETEAGEYMREIATVLHGAGLKPALVIMGAETGHGAGIAVHGLEDTPTLAKAIQHAFGAAGIELPTILRSELKNGEFFVFVGAKN